MTLPASISSKRYAILGLGRNGKAVMQALVDNDVSLVAWDDTAQSREALPETLQRYLAPTDDWDWHNLDALVLSPGIPLTHPKPHGAVALAKEYQIEITGDLDIWAETVPDSFKFGVTGTNGKSTTTHLITHILQSAGVEAVEGGNLGAATMGLPLLVNDTGAYVIECSSYQLDLLHSARFDYAIWLNITPDHIDRHGDISGYIKAKEHLIEAQHAEDMLIIGVDDMHSREVADRWQALRDVVRISSRERLNSGVSCLAGELHDASFDFETYALIENQHLAGVHNAQNIAAAYAACRAYGIEAQDIINGLASYKALAHRCEYICEADGISAVNDSKATNADAVKYALGAFTDIFWIAGGIAKDGGIEPLLKDMEQVECGFFYGQDGALLKSQFDNTGKEAGYYSSMQLAVEAAYEAAKQHGKGTLLLSPACASFDQFKSFEDRGEQFAQLAKGILGCS